MAFLTWLASFLAGPLLGKAVDAYKAKLDAGNTHDRIVADVAARELALDQREAELNSAVVLAEQGNWITRLIRPAFALPFIFFTWKVVVWDTMLGWGVTPELSARMWGVFMAVVVAYFGGRTVEKVVNRIWKR